MQHPQKWRETIDPFSLPYRTFTPLEILGYPHAGNDVFHARGLYQGQEVRAYIKVARQKGAAIHNEVALLAQPGIPHGPKVIDFGLADTPFSVTLELPGERLSVLLKENPGMNLRPYLREYGRTLAELHRLTPDAPAVADRRFFHAPAPELCQKLGLDGLTDYFSCPPENQMRCFCHGDFHYANVLWLEGHISGILDFELSGYGNRDFDIAWTIFCRPGQQFLQTPEEAEAFLSGYGELGDYDPGAVRFYLAQIGVYFLSFCGEDEAYCRRLRAFLENSGKNPC